MVSIIVQGRPHPNSIDRIQEYRKYGPVLYSYPAGDSLPPLDGVEPVPFYATVEPSTFNICSGYYHCYSILAGLQKATTEFTIKLRSDIFVGNLQPMIDRLVQNPDKYVCSDIYFRPDHIAKFHPSDQIVGMRTDRFIETMKIALYRLTHHSAQLRQCFNDSRQTTNEFYLYPLPEGVEGSKYEDGDADEGMGHGLGLTPEVLFGTSYLAAKGVIQVPAQSKQIMRDHFEVVQLETMFPYRDRYGNVDKIHYGGLPVIRSMEDL